MVIRHGNTFQFETSQYRADFFSPCRVMTGFLFSGQNTKSTFWESVLRPQEETTVSSQTSTEKRYSVSVIVIHAWPLPCVIDRVSTLVLQSRILICLNLAANAKNKKRKAEEEDDDEESTQTRMSSKQVRVVCSCWRYSWIYFPLV